MNRPVDVSKRMDEEPPGPQILLPCPVCFRTFKMESLERHRSICQVVAVKKRKVFDSAKQRIRGTDIPPTSATPPVARSAAPSTLGRKFGRSIKTPASGWKEKHLALIRTVREARNAAINRCPYCERNFGDKAYDRHVEWCREQQCRIPKSPINQEAKERWEARTKYRAPALRRSMRLQTRDKYSPTRQYATSGGHYAASDFGGCAGGGGRDSLHGSRASLDSRASSTYSYQSCQPMTTTASSAPASAFATNNSHLYGNNVNNINNRNYRNQMSSYSPHSSYGNNAINAFNANQTVGRATGNAFLRNAVDRRSLRIPPQSPPPLRHAVHSPPAPVIQLTPLNNNRASALRASLRAKTNTETPTSPFSYVPKSPKPAPRTASYTRTTTPSMVPVVSAAPVVSTAPIAAPSATVGAKSSRPSMLQLFTSAFSRSSPSSTSTPASTPASAASSTNGRAKSGSFFSSTPTNVSSASSPGRRSEPEGLEAKVATSSCTVSYPPILTTITSKQKPSRDSKYINEGYDPYLSAQRQMAELFDDDKRSDRTVTAAAPASPLPASEAPKTPPTPEAPKTSAVSGTLATPESSKWASPSTTEEVKKSAEAAPTPTATGGLRSSFGGLFRRSVKPSPPPKPVSLASLSSPTANIRELTPLRSPPPVRAPPPLTIPAQAPSSPPPLRSPPPPSSPPPLRSPPSPSSPPPLRSPLLRSAPPLRTQLPSRAPPPVPPPDYSNSTENEDPANMEQLEQDLKSILSDISQLGKPKSQEPWGRDPVVPSPAKSRLSGVGSFSNSATNNRSSGLYGNREPPASPVPPPLAKFCHSCGSAYPERYHVKFCCECGVKRLYI